MRWSLFAALSVFSATQTGCSGQSANPAEAASVAAIIKLGGKIELDEINPDRPVVKVDLHDTAATDSDLSALGSLKRVHNLYLGRTRVTDAGLKHVQGLAELRTLSLNGTAVTDSGLEFLAGLANLKTLNLQETQVTAAGAGKLRQKLPNLAVAR